MRIIKALHAISADVNISTEEKLQRLLHLGLDALGLDIGLVSHIEDERYTVISAVSPGDAIEKGATFALGDTYCRDTLVADKIVSYSDASNELGVAHPGYRNFSLQSYIGIPFRVSGERYGTVNFSSLDARGRPFTTEEQDYLVLLAEWIGTELTRQQQLQAIFTQQKALEHQHRLHIQMSKLAKVGTWEMNQVTEEVTLSDSLRKLFEIPDDPVLTFDDVRCTIFREEDLEMLRAKMAHSRATGEPWSFEFEAVTMKGKRFWAQSQGVADISDPDNVRYYGATQDVTEHVRVNKELEQRRQVAESALASRSQFLANMSHEIRTPINGIVGMLDALGQTSLDEEQQQFCRLATQSADGLLQIVNDVLDFSKIDAGELELENIPVDICRIAEEQVRLFQLPANKKGLLLEMDTGNTDGLKLCGDPTRIRQIFSNLISNAIKFTEKGNISVKLRSKQQNNGRHLIQIIVQDDGIGIKPEHQATIFSPFRQGDSETTRRYGGTGLGLSIVAQIAELMNGGIRVNSEYGKGSTFVVALSLDDADGSDVMKDEPEYNTGHSDDLADNRVLVVEDNEINQIVVCEQLKQFGIASDIAVHGADAVDKVIRSIASGTMYDLILMDCQMPVMDGYEAATKIRQLGGQAQIVPIIALTANVLVGEREKCLLAGMNDYLSKPIEKAVFTRCLHRYLLA